VRPCVGTTKSHISHVVLDAPKWEHSVAYQLERMPEVIAYARNDHLDFTIPYEWQGRDTSIARTISSAGAATMGGR
jgi:type III restriction enzyme